MSAIVHGQGLEETVDVRTKPDLGSIQPARDLLSPLLVEEANADNIEDEAWCAAVNVCYAAAIIQSEEVNQFAQQYWGHRRLWLVYTFLYTAQLSLVIRARVEHKFR